MIGNWLLSLYSMTSERECRLLHVLAHRQFDITVVLENVWDPHNISAVLRSCDAVGIQDVYIISSREKRDSKLGKKSSASASKWLTIHHYHDVNECFRVVRQRYLNIFTTRLRKDATPLHAINFCQPLALVFGNEKEGVSPIAESLSDGNFIIPQVGMIKSLNISVACAVTLYECYRQRHAGGMYNQPAQNAESMELLQKWRSV